MKKTALYKNYRKREGDFWPEIEENRRNTINYGDYNTVVALASTNRL